MLFVWTSDGGPLQHVGLALFLVQLMPPFLTAMSAHLPLPGVPITAVVGSMLILALTALFFCWGTGAVSQLVEPATQFVVEATGALRHTTGISSNGRLALLLGSMVVGFSVLLLFTNAYLISSLFHIIGVCLILRAHLRRGLGDRNVRGAGGTESECQEAKMEEIVNIIQKMPVEEFLSEESLLEKCSISRLKKMLEVRRQPMTEGSCLERQDLVDAVNKSRNYSDSCVICCEEYREGDPLRILPRCRHEFHLECLDQWAYTFANRSKRQRQPSCPLYNEALK
uniref:RING-type domain-containing protein n=1 Tax=Odontella aurita TaxID=265563 RepID=A0A6U6GZY6_9STRA|mmetsp:Transcript_44963/g.137334  ORF Transcript_44963/g.137334 Transcript_44963/m.137334 type:complete len:283 (+) Transcript_44963:127-975(+)